MEPLQRLRSSILPLASCVREVEAVVEAFIQELAEITLPEGEDNVPTSDLEVAEMEENLRRVLNENQGLVSFIEPICRSSDKSAGLRPHGALPLVVMTPDDILAELQVIRNRSRNAETTERVQTEDFIRQIAARYVASSLSPCFHSFLSILGPYIPLYLIFMSIHLCTLRLLLRFHQQLKTWNHVSGRQRENCKESQIQSKKNSKIVLQRIAT